MKINKFLFVFLISIIAANVNAGIYKAIGCTSSTLALSALIFKKSSTYANYVAMQKLRDCPQEKAYEELKKYFSGKLFEKDSQGMILHHHISHKDNAAHQKELAFQVAQAELNKISKGAIVKEAGIAAVLNLVVALVAYKL